MWIDFGQILLLAVAQGWYVAVLYVECVEPSGGSVGRPRGERLVVYYVTGGAVCRIHIEIGDALAQSVGHHSHGVVGVHAARVARALGERGQPEAVGLLRHGDERADYVALFLGLEQHAQRMCGAVGVPDPVVGIVWRAVVLVNLAV